MTYGDASETFDPGEVYTIASPEPAFEPDDWPTREELAVTRSAPAPAPTTSTTTSPPRTNGWLVGSPSPRPATSA